MTVVSLPTWMAPVFARATSASRVSVCPASAGLSAPRRSAVEPETATPIVSRPAACSARAAASITTPLPVPAGPTRTAARSGPVRTSSAWCCSGLSGPPMRSATSRAALSRAMSPTSRPAGWASWVARRSIACSWARTARVVIRPPSRVSTRRSRTISRATASASSGASSPAACSSTTARRSRSWKTACCSVSFASTRSSIARVGRWALGCADQPHGLIRAEAVIAAGLYPRSL